MLAHALSGAWGPCSGHRTLLAAVTCDSVICDSGSAGHAPQILSLGNARLSFHTIAAPRKKKKCRESTCVGVHTRVCETESCHPPPKPGRPSYPGRLSHGDCPHPQVPQWHVPDGSLIKNLPAVQEMQVQCLGREDPLEEEMATHSSILAWRIPWTEEPGGLQPMGSQRVRHN